MKRRNVLLGVVFALVLGIAGCGGGGGGSDSSSPSTGGSSGGSGTSKTGTITLIVPDYPTGSTVQEVSLGKSQTGPWTYSVGTIQRNSSKNVTVAAPSEYWVRWKLLDSIGGYAPIYKTAKVGNLVAGGNLRFAVVGF